MIEQPPPIEMRADTARIRVTEKPPLRSAGFDRDDIFGLRRAMAGLPESLRDSLMRRWALIGARCEYNVSLVHADVQHEAQECGHAWLAEAWLTVEEAMKAYLAWKRQSHLRRTSPRDEFPTASTSDSAGLPDANGSAIGNAG